MTTLTIIRNLAYDPVTSTTGGSSDGIIAEQIKKGLTDFCQWVGNGILDVLTPFFEWGTRIVIVWCITMVFVSKDKSSLSTAMKCFILYLLFEVIKGAIK